MVSSKDQLVEAEKKLEKAEEAFKEAKRNLDVAKDEVSKMKKQVAEEKKSNTGKKSEKLRDPQDLKLLSKFPLEIKGRKIEAHFEAINGTLKWPAVLCPDGFKCTGQRKFERAKCPKPNSRLAEHHTQEELKEMIYRHAACAMGAATGPRPDFPIVVSNSTNQKK